MNLKAVIFDMDGVIVDSEPIESRALEVMLKENGKTPIFNKQGLIHVPGNTLPEYWKSLMESYQLGDKAQEARLKKRKIFEDIIHQGITPIPGTLELIKELRSKNIKIALASSRDIKHIFLIVEVLKMKNDFDAIIGPSETIRRKPFPDIYLETAKALGVLPAFCVALEDTEIGIASAKAAGMKVVVVPNKYTQNQDFSKADTIVKSLTKINISVLENL